MPDQEFTQNIRVDGAEEAKRKLDEVGEATEGVAKETEKAGDSGKKAGGEFVSMNSILGDVGKSLQTLIVGMISFQSAMSGFREYIAYLEKMRDLQRELSSGTMSYSEAVTPLRNQLSVDERAAIDIHNQLMQGGLKSGDVASRIGVQADIELGDRGGLLAEDNLEIAKIISQFSGQIDADGSQGADIVRFLKSTGQLGSPEQVKLAISKIQAAAQASRAATIGDFVAQLLEGGMGMAQGEGAASLDDILEIGGMAVATETTGAKAAMTMDFLRRLISGKGQEDFTAEMTRVAASKGLTYDDMKKGDRLNLAREIFAGIDSQSEENRIAALLSQDQGGRLIAAFRKANVDATSGVGSATDVATAEMFDQSMVDYQNTALYRDRMSVTVANYEKAIGGFETALMDSIEKIADARLKVNTAAGETTWTLSDEYYTERYMLDIFQAISEGLEKAGIETSGDLADLRDPMSKKRWAGGRVWGWDDDYIRKIAEQIAQVQRENPGTVPQIINHITVVQHQQVDGGNGYESTYVDLPGD